MSADALIGATIQVALETALSLAADNIGSFFGFKKDLASMTQSLLLIRAFLSDVEKRQVQDAAVQEWLKSLEGVAFDADNLLDELNYEFLRHEVESRYQSKRKRSFISFLYPLFNSTIGSRGRMASMVKDINMQLGKINKEASKLGLTSRLAMITAFPAAATVGGAISWQTDSVVAPIIGRANDESKIVKMLLSPSKKIISVIPITGMAGLGKTTLAKSIYNNKEIDGHFHKKIWVCVSKEVKTVELFKLILVQLEEKIEVNDRNVIVQKIGKLLEGKRYFLVLDDVWNHEQGLWDDFFITLKGLNPTNGTWCLVTTRLEQLAHAVSKLLMMDIEPYFLGRLTDDDCWSILKEKAIGGEEEPVELKAIRDKVIRRCDGLPLAASIIGGLLCLSAKENWLFIVEKSLLSGDVEQILKVSFDYLPSASVKKCFAYCSIFPKDTKMEKESLIELWMAEGFLVPSLDNETVMEKIGDKYLRVLLQSSLFEEKRSSYDRRVYYTMHDLVHDLAESISKSKSINMEAGVMDNNFQVRYLAVNSALEKNHFENISTSLRTLFLKTDMSGEILSKFKNLHVLKLSGAKTRELPTTIDQLIHLRHIDLSHSQIQALPESLCKLYNLQTLRLIHCDNLKVLPKGMSNLISLRHLHYYTDDASFKMPLEMGRLTCLQTLEFFNVGQEKGHGIEELECLKGLKGKLEIRNLELVKGKEKAEKASLIGKEDLFRLELLWGSRNGEGDNSSDEEVLKGLRPCSNLQELVIENFIGDQFPQWFMHLSRLVDLELRNCSRCRKLPVALGRLPSLQHVKLNKLESITSIGLSFYGIDNHSNSSSLAGPMTTLIFPVLKTLSLEKMENLVEWIGAKEEVRSTTATTGGGGESFEEVLDVFPVLETLIIKECSKLITTPSHFPSLKKLEISGNNHVSLLESILLSKGINNTLSTLKVYGRYDYYSDVPDNIVATDGFFNNNNATVFQNLKDVSFQYYPYVTSISGWFCPCLESLELKYCKNLRGKLPAEDLFEFQSLRKLKILKCPRVVIIPEALPKLTSLELLIIDGCNELTNLPLEMPKSLRRLEVDNCPNLVSFPLEALPNLVSLEELSIAGCNELTNLPLEMPKSLRRLKVDNCPNLVSFSLKALPNLVSLEELSIAGCNKLTNLLLEMPKSLRMLKVDNCPNLISLSLEALPNLVSLEELSIAGCNKLTNLPLEMPKSLRRLKVDNCPNLVSFLLEALPNLVSLEELSIAGCNELTNLPLEMPKSLKRLKVDNCPNLVSFPLEVLPNLVSLEELSIGGCNELTNLPLEMPKSLLWLEVYNCQNLVSFPLDLQQTPSLLWLRLESCPKLKTEMTPKGFGFLTSLRFLSIGPFSDDDENAFSVYNEFDWDGILQSSSTLQTLFLYGLPHMESLPHQLQYLTTLIELWLLDFGGIEALPDWIGNLQSLHSLFLLNCEKLRCLPSMDAMTRLTKLTDLWVINCPLLKERCSPSCPTDSSEWSKIVHIRRHHFI